MVTGQTQTDDGRLSPRTYLRKRRPEQFSDSTIEERSSLDRSILEYHLGSITSRSQELLFENFARKLAQRVICPNLVPHTGPTGGGDSKVDSETFPVADALAHTWYVGVASSASSERWAFAFSAKRDWKPKVISDIKKIADTGRDYKKAFFVSNQYIPDRVRASVEDALSEEHGIDIRILDRSWILDSVFDGNCEDLAIDELGMEISRRQRVKLGPLDAERRASLDAFEQRIKQIAEEEKFDSVFVEDCIDAAITSRELELPQAEVEGRFLRAERAAKKWGTKHQKLQAVYQRAWTLHFWYEDPDEIPELYLKCESMVKGTNSSHDLELLSNLWFVVNTIGKHEATLVPVDWMAERTSVLLAEVDRLTEEDDRPSNALQARTIGLLVRLLMAEEDREPLLRELRMVVESCEGLVGFPARSLFNIVTDLGEYLGSSTEYERLFESTVRITSIREGELTTAKMLLKRGGQQLAGGRPADAIRVVGRALTQLYRHESRDQMVIALYLLAVAYQNIGMLWAARGSALTAASIVANDFHSYGSVTARQADCAEKLKWIELELGRLSQSWDWHQLDLVVKDIISRQNNEVVEPHDFNYDAVMAIQILRLPIVDLKHMTTSVEVLEKLWLPASALALRYALGHENDLPEALMGEDIDDPRKTFARWRDQPASRQLVHPPTIGEAAEETLTATVLGCRITASVENRDACVALAETVLAGLESLMSTSMMARVAPLGPRITMQIRRGHGSDSLVEFSRKDEDGLPAYEIRCSEFNPHKLPQNVRHELQDKISELILDVLAHAFLIGDVEAHLTALFRDERALERALNFTQSFVHVGNVLGHSPKTRISQWSQEGGQACPLVRTEKWDSAIPPSEERKRTDEPVRPGVGPAPKELNDEANMAHTDFRTTTVIRQSLWDAAEWCAMGFFLDPRMPAPPGIALVFKNKDAAAKIFEVWQKEFGDKASEEIRITVVKGIDKKHPFRYRVAIGANPEIALRDSKFTMFFSRLHTMTPNSPKNLDTFLATYEHFKCFLLVPGYAEPGAPMFEIIEEHALLMRNLAVRDAWEIGQNDVDLSAISEEDDPIVPDGMTDPPYLKALKQKRELRGT